MTKRGLFGLIGATAAILVVLGLLSVTAVPVAAQDDPLVGVDQHDDVVLRRRTSLRIVVGNQ